MKTLPPARDIADFWRHAGPARWFSKSEDFDAEFKTRFEAAHHAAATGALDAWASEAEGALALLVLLDQFPRNAWRGSGHMFATDGKALAVARAAVDAGLDQQIEARIAALFLFALHAFGIPGRPGAFGRAQPRARREHAAFCRAAPRHHCPLRPLSPPQRGARPRNHAAKSERFSTRAGSAASRAASAQVRIRHARATICAAGRGVFLNEP